MAHRAPGCGALCLLALLAGCAMAPSYPDPKPDHGQIVVLLKGVPREGVKPPAREAFQDDYASRAESVERGNAYQRVRYDEIHDVVAYLWRTDGTSIAEPPLDLGKAQTPAIPVGVSGFGTAQEVYVDFGGTIVAEFDNDLGQAIDLFFEGSHGAMQTLTLKPGAKNHIKLPTDFYVVTCDQLAGTSCRLYGTSAGKLWHGQSGDQAFFDGLAPGEYQLTVFAPRLPVVQRTVSVKAATRKTVTAELTVNVLPKFAR